MGIVRNIVKRNFHRDSLQLLRLSEEAKKIDGIRDAAVVMGTPTNKEILTKLSLLTDEGRGASENDMIFAVMAESESQIEKGLRQIEEMVLKPPAAKGGRRFYSFDAALQAVPDANLALVSIPGEYAREIVLKALDKGLSVHLFSDHVPPEHELELKQYAKQKGLLVMGPGAGTAIIGGRAVAFANVVKKGRTGIVAAAGTGLQEVSVLLSEAGLGVSVGLGTGGGDVKAKIGGLMMIQSIDALEQDPQSDTIVVLSKPPDETVKKLMLNHIATRTKKHYVTCFLGPESYEIPASARNRIRGTKTLHAAFLEATRAIEPGSELAKRFELPSNELIALSNKAGAPLNAKQRYIRGLYTGGTLAYETLIILGKLIGEVFSNAPIDPRLKLDNSYQSMKDSIVDLGEEEFTSGRAHPMIDPTIRKLRLVEEARDPEVAVIMMDIMLGYGSHMDPAGAMLSAIADAKDVAGSDGRKLPMLAHVCGTEQDPQPLSEQVTKLQNVGVHVFATNAQMAIAGALISRRSIPNATLESVWQDLLRGF
jgi:FdrA protein